MTTETTDNIVSQDAQAAPTTPTSFRELLPAELADDPSLRDIKDITTLAKNYVETKRFVGNSIRKPSADAAPEELSAFEGTLKELLGVPKDDTGYKYEFPEGTMLPPAEDIHEFNKKAIAHGLTQKQADAMLREEVRAYQESIEATKAEVAKSEAALKAQWGVKYDEQMAKVNEAVKQLSSKFGEDMQSLAESGALRNPALLTVLAELGQMGRESAAHGITLKSNLKTPAEARAEIMKIRMDKTHAINNPADPRHEAARAYLDSLYEMEVAHLKSGKD